MAELLKRILVAKSTNVVIGDLGIKLRNIGDSIDLLKEELDGNTKKRLEDIIASSDLDLAIANDLVDFFDENGNLLTGNQAFRATNMATLYDAIGGASAINDFIDLDDTPSAYSSNANIIIKVNSAETGVTFANNVVIDDNGQVGVGTTSPQTLLHTSDTTPRGVLTPGSGSIPFPDKFYALGDNTDLDSFFSTGSSVAMQSLPSSSQIFGLVGCALVDHTSGSVSIASGLYANVENNDTGTLNAGNGLLSQVYNIGTGIITTARGIRADVINNSTGTISEAIGLDITITNSTGTITEAKGIQIGSTTAISSWGIYISADINNYFEGSIGIGTSDPSSFKLQVDGHVGPNSNDTYDLGSDSLRWRDIYLGPGTVHIGTSTSDEGTLSYDTTGNDVTLDATGSVILGKIDGSVGIGTSSAGANFNIQGTSSSTLSVSSSGTNSSSTLFLLNDVSLWVLTNDGSDGDKFKISNFAVGNIITVTTGSDVGIGTTDPLVKLQVEDNDNTTIASVSTDSDSSSILSLANDADQWDISIDGTDEDKFKIETSALNEFIIDTSGNIGIGTNIGLNEKLTINGAITIGDSDTDTECTIRHRNNDFEGNLDGTEDGWESLINYGYGYGYGNNKRKQEHNA